jgi:hypothetical protein
MRYEITAPDGRRFAITAPEGATQEQVLAYAQQQMGGSAPPEEDAGRGGGALPFLNRGIASVLGMPVDLANLALKYTGMPVSDRPFGGSASIESGMSRFGRATGARMVPGVEQEPETPAEYIGRGVGESVGMLVPGYGAARLAASSANPLVAGVAQRIAQAPVGSSTGRLGQFVAPTSTVAGELASGAGAGAGRFVGEEYNPDSPYGGMIGELVGGVSPGLAGMLLRYGPTGLVTRAVGRAREVQADPTRAPGRLQSLTADPEAAAVAAETPSIADLTPAQRTQEQLLLSLERAVAQADPTIAQALRDRAEAAQATLLDETRALGGDPTQTRAFLETRRDRLNTALQTRVEQARARADERIAELEPSSSAEDASRVVREEFDKAYDTARTQENELWNAIPQDVRVETAPLFERFQALVDKTPSTGQEDIPAYARRFLGREATDERADAVTSQLNLLYPGAFPPRQPSQRLGATATPAELQRMRSKLLEMERLAYREGRRTEGSTIGQIADDVLETMNSIPDMPGPYAVARDFTRRLNQTFREGPTRPLTRTEDSASYIPEELTLSRLIGQGGVQGGVAESALRAATSDPRNIGAGQNEVVQNAVQDYLTRSLRNRAVTAEGRMKPEAAESWMRSNEALLEQYPQLRETVTNALEAQTRARGAEARQIGVSRNLENPRETAIARFLEGNPNDAVTRIFRADNPVEAATSLRRSAARDSSGAALAGLRGAFVDNVLASSRQTGPNGEVFRGSTILEMLNGPKQRAVFEAVFSPEELNRLRQIGTEFTALERARGDLPDVGGVVVASQNRLINRLAQLGGAAVGRKISQVTGTGNIQTPAIASSALNNFVTNLGSDRAERLISRAVTDRDPALFAALMRDSRTPRQQDEAVRRLQGWMAGPAGRALFEEESADPQQGVGSVQNIYGSVMNPEASLASTQSLINSPAMRNRIGAIFETPAYADLFTATLNREAQLFHRANQTSRGASTAIGGFDQSLTRLVTQAVQNGQLDEARAVRITEMLASNNPTSVAAAIRALENVSNRRPQ